MEAKKEFKCYEQTGGGVKCKEQCHNCKYASGITEEEKSEKMEDLLKCECGCTMFRVYVSIIIDDARLYCAHCNASLFS